MNKKEKSPTLKEIIEAIRKKKLDKAFKKLGKCSYELDDRGRKDNTVFKELTK